MAKNTFNNSRGQTPVIQAVDESVFQTESTQEPSVISEEQGIDIQQKTNTLPVLNKVNLEEVAIVTPVVEQAATTIEENKDSKYKDAPVGVDCKGMLLSIEASQNKHAIDCVDGLINYLNEMKPGKQMDEAVGSRHQLSLFRVFQFLVNSESDDFNNTFAVVLKMVDDNIDGCFSPRYSHRFTNTMLCSATDVDGFNRFMNLLTTASAVKGRAQAIKQIDFTKTLQFGFNDSGRQRILSFFNI